MQKMNAPIACQPPSSQLLRSKPVTSQGSRLILERQPLLGQTSMWLAKTRISHNSSGWPSNQNKKFKGSKVELENLRMELKVMPLQSQTREGIKGFRDQRLRGRGGRRKGRGEWRTSPWAQLLAVRGLLVSHLVVTKWELPHTPGSETLLAQSQYPCGLKASLELLSIPATRSSSRYSSAGDWKVNESTYATHEAQIPQYDLHQQAAAGASGEWCTCKSASCGQESSQFSQEQMILWLCSQRTSLP